MILLTKFAESRNEKADTVRKYINRHKEQFEGHFEVNGHQMLIDEKAVEILGEVYPLPKLVEVVNGVDPMEYAEVLKQKSDIQNELTSLQNLYREKIGLISQAEATMKLLEDKEKLVEELKNANESLAEYNISLREENAKANLLCEMQEKELEKLKNRTFLERLLGKYE